MRFLRERTVFQPCDISPARRIRRTIDACTRAHVHASCTCTRTRLVSKSPGPFIGGSLQPGGRTEKGCAGGGRGEVHTVVFHITVTCYRARSLRHAINRRLPLPWVARKEGTGVGGVYRGVIVAPYTPPSNPRANLCDAVYGYVTVVTSFSSLSPVLTWDRSSKNRAPKISRKSKMTMTGLEFVSFVLIYSDVYLIILFLVYISKL